MANSTVASNARPTFGFRRLAWAVMVLAMAAPANAANTSYPATTPADTKSDPSFRSLFQSWKRQDGPVQPTMSIPSAKPVEGVTFTSGFGVRSDPFRGGAAMHAGIDLAGPMGTPIYATADGIVGRAKWASGYGNLIELEHGRGIQTRYGHLSKILVSAGTRVKRGDLIGHMGSTGRSTGSHLHYEVRLDGHAVSPLPYLKTADYVVALQERGDTNRVALGGPDVADAEIAKD